MRSGWSTVEGDSSILLKHILIRVRRPGGIQSPWGKGVGPGGNTTPPWGQGVGNPENRTPPWGRRVLDYFIGRCKTETPIYIYTYYKIPI